MAEERGLSQAHPPPTELSAPASNRAATSPVSDSTPQAPCDLSSKGGLLASGIIHMASGATIDGAGRGAGELGSTATIPPSGRGPSTRAWVLSCKPTVDTTAELGSRFDPNARR